MSRSNRKRSRLKPPQSLAPSQSVCTETPTPQPVTASTPDIPAETNDNNIENTAEILESLQMLLQRFDQLDGRLDGWAVQTLACATPADSLGSQESAPSDPDNCVIRNDAALDELQDDLLHLQATLDAAWRTNEELRHQNETLAAQVAQSNVRQTVQAAQGGDESLTWEDRKQLIMRQMEEDSFDADAFIDSLSSSALSQGDAADHDATLADHETLSPHEFVERLVEKLQYLEQTIRNRDIELGELRMLLDNQSKARIDGTAIGAAAIASMIDSDALVMEERERLQQLKNDWEDKFRKAEIEASLERAKLSRERQELAKRTEELEEKLDELQREKRDQLPHPKPGRRWLAELGLGTDAS